MTLGGLMSAKAEAAPPVAQTTQVRLLRGGRWCRPYYYGCYHQHHHRHYGYYHHGHRGHYHRR
jgi:hypothetical protein